MGGEIYPKMEFDPLQHFRTVEKIFQDFSQSLDSGSSQLNCVVFLVLRDIA